ncbi:MAG: PDZ domain-containing protein, partial [Phycisphaerae bacterium]|nr:PDZ domain-containing protein [Phycisphaerae bacterium]
MAFLLPLSVIIPLGAAFLIPLAQLIRSKKGCPAGEVIALAATAALVVISLCGLATRRTVTTWIGGYEAKSELLGLTGTTLPHTSEGEADPARPRGVVIEQAVPGSAAAEAGLQEGDIITGWKLPSDKRFGPVWSMNELRRQNAALEPGSIMILQVERNGSTLEEAIKAGKSVAGIAMVGDGLTRLLLVIIGVVSFTAV